MVILPGPGSYLINSSVIPGNSVTNSWNVLGGTFIASDTFIYDIPTISANSMIEFDIAYANAKEGDVFLAYSAAVSKIIVAAACYVDGTVRVGIYNPDSIAINPPPAEFTVKRIR